ncbi:MAG: hypothetical protein NVSMB21_24820 [Vulcanimicrobiaceae bacterium]
MVAVVRAHLITMTNVHERAHLPSPGGRPQPLAFHGVTLYVGSRDTSHLYGIDPATRTIVDDVALPGPPFGLVSHGGELHVVVSVGDDDDRYLYRYVPGRPFNTEQRVELPERHGSNLASDGRTLYLVQATNSRIVALASDGTIERAVALPTRVAGACFHEGTLYTITADEEFEHLELAKLAIDASPASVTPIASISSDARSLAFGAGAWWTNYRDRSEIVSIAFD